MALLVSPPWDQLWDGVFGRGRGPRPKRKANEDRGASEERAD